MSARSSVYALALCALTLTTAAAAELPQPPAGPPLDWCDVRSVVDGDTYRLMCDGKKVNARLYCIDAPEMDQAPWGEVARDKLAALTTRRVQVQVKALDRWQRPVVEIVTQGEPSPGLALVAAGGAAVYPRYCTDPAYFAAEATARAAGLGIWSTAGLQQTPWIWRHQGRR